MLHWAGMRCWHSAVLGAHQTAEVLEGMEGDRTHLDGDHSLELIRHLTADKGEQVHADAPSA